MLKQHNTNVFTYFDILWNNPDNMMISEEKNAAASSVFRELFMIRVNVVSGRGSLQAAVNDRFHLFTQQMNI